MIMPSVLTISAISSSASSWNLSHIQSLSMEIQMLRKPADSLIKGLRPSTHLHHHKPDSERLLLTSPRLWVKAQAARRALDSSLFLTNHEVVRAMAKLRYLTCRKIRILPRHKPRSLHCIERLWLMLPHNSNTRSLHPRTIRGAR